MDFVLLAALAKANASFRQPSAFGALFGVLSLAGDWFFMNLGGHPLTALLILLVAKSLLAMATLELLDRFDDSILIWMAVLIAGSAVVMVAPRWALGVLGG
ncbi:hypothetical protein [Amphibiibacter pelophylacis]|uniref:Uncharacterized protein n=1 Tax=Amphibiibacter pelophylacis TaxID=1799477 RepID=A0ACC6NZJ0_9BURK